MMALKVIGGAYLPSLEARGLRDARRVVDGILERHDYFVPHGKSGGVHPQSAYAVLNVAERGGKGEDPRWGRADGYPKDAAQQASGAYAAGSLN